MLRTTAQVAILLAVAFEATVYGWTPGIGHLLFWMCALGATVACNRAAERPALPSPWMFGPALLFALSVFLYDAVVVRVWSSALGMLSLLWAVAWNLLHSRREGALGRLFPLSTFHPLSLARAGSETWKPLVGRSSECGKPALSVLRGLLLAVPLLFVFGVLLCSADQVFARALDSLGREMGQLSFQVPLRIALWLSLFSAWIKLWLSAPPAEAPRSRTLFGATELMVALGSVNLLLLAFLAVQARYLFGGAALVEALGLHYAEYARKGFFELSACIALILPLVMLAYRAAQHHGEASLRWLGGALVLQAGGLAVSAFRRMLLYIDTYGLSVERFYAAAGILVALTVLAWAAYACLRPQDVSWVMARQTVTVLFLLGALSLVNVEGRVCRFNLERARQGKGLDLEYFRTLSVDAVPPLVQALPTLTVPQRASCLKVLEQLGQEVGSDLGVSANLSRGEAAALLRGVLPQKL